MPFDPKPFGGAVKGGTILIYSIITLVLAGLAVYMAMVADHPLTSGYVAAPAIGALWFGLRLFMILSARK
jgi:hypothetical protein